MQDPETAAPATSPFASLAKGSTLEAVVVGCRTGQDLPAVLDAKGRPKTHREAHKRLRKLRLGSRGLDRVGIVHLQLSARPSVLQQAQEGVPLTRVPLEWADVSVGQSLTG